MTDRTHFVYRIFDDRDLLLYVGCTGNFEKRMKQHRADRRTNVWIGYADRAKLEGPFERDRAFRRESEVIESERPYFNVLVEHKKITTARNAMRKRLFDDLRREQPHLFIKGDDEPLPHAFLMASDAVDERVEREIPPADAAYRHRLYLNARVASRVVSA